MLNITLLYRLHTERSYFEYIRNMKHIIKLSLPVYSFLGIAIVVVVVFLIS